MTFIYLLQKLWFMIVHGEIIGDKTDMIKNVIRYILVSYFTDVRGSVGAKEEAESFIIKLACMFPHAYAL